MTGLWSRDDAEEIIARRLQLDALHIDVEQEPAQKSQRHASVASAEFLQAASAALEFWPFRPSPRRRVVVSLRFTCSRNQPPSLANLAKFYLDLLYSMQARVVDDDEQVAALYVSRHQGDTGAVRASVRPWASVLEAMDLAKKVLIEVRASQPEYQIDEDSIYSRQEVSERFDPHVEYEGTGNENLDRTLAELDLHFGEQERLRRSWESVRILQQHARLLGDAQTPDFASILLPAMANMIFRSDRLAFDPLPQKSGDSEPFKTGATAVVEDWLRNHGTLKSQYEQPGATVLFRTAGSEFDVDNAFRRLTRAGFERQIAGPAGFGSVTLLRSPGLPIVSNDHAGVIAFVHQQQRTPFWEDALQVLSEALKSGF